MGERVLMTKTVNPDKIVVRVNPVSDVELGCSNLQKAFKDGYYIQETIVVQGFTGDEVLAIMKLKYD